MAFFGIEIVLLVRPLLEVLGHEDCVFEGQKIGGTAELLNFRQGPRRSSGGSERNHFWKFKIVFRHVLVTFGVQTLTAKLNKLN